MILYGQIWEINKYEIIMVICVICEFHNTSDAYDLVMSHASQHIETKT